MAEITIIIMINPIMKNIDQTRSKLPSHSLWDSVLNRNFFKYSIHYIIVEAIPVVVSLSATMWLLLLSIFCSTLYSQWPFSLCNLIVLFLVYFFSGSGLGSIAWFYSGVRIYVLQSLDYLPPNHTQKERNQGE